ncbi:MAG: hypothetical protein M9890_10895 [Thermomicrobiales bacterium]|nr:hypothetical protein [Thermomicrobiales bacterium]
MTRGYIRTLALVGVLLFSLTAAALPSAASAQDTYAIHFPWVPNNDAISGLGSWSAVVAFHNVSDTPCALSVFVVQGGTWTRTAQLSLNAASTRTIGASSLGVPKPGSPMRLEAACQIAASIKTFSPPTASSPWSDGTDIVSGYTGLTGTDIAASRHGADAGWVLPLVQTNSGWNTLITVANLGDTSADTSLKLYAFDNANGPGGAEMTFSRSLAPGEAWTLNAEQVLSRVGWIGFARLTSNGDLGVIARRIKPSSNMAMTNVGIATSSLAQGSYRTAAPLLFNAYNGWNTGITLANPSAVPATVTVEYMAADGGYVTDTQLVVPPSAMQYIYTPSDVSNAGFVGSANITSNVPIISSVDEVKYETTEGLSYTTTGARNKELAIPLLFREGPQKGKSDNSGISISNLDPLSSTTVQIELLSIYGVDLLEAPVELIIPPGGVGVIYLPFIDAIAPGTVVTARLSASNSVGIVAISNDINYAVAGDGSTVFSATGSAGVYIAGGAGQ